MLSHIFHFRINLVNPIDPIIPLPSPFQFLVLAHALDPLVVDVDFLVHLVFFLGDGGRYLVEGVLEGGEGVGGVLRED